VAVEDRTGRRLPPQGEGAALWDGGTIAAITSL
jgi:hypothetical protein